MIVIEVDKNPNENTVTLLRRFTKKVQGAKILNAIRDKKHATRPMSKLRKKRHLLKSLETAAHYEKMKKLGKLKLPVKKR